MPECDLLDEPPDGSRRFRRGAALTFVLLSVLAAGAAAGAWTDGHRSDDSADRSRTTRPGPADSRRDVADAAEEALSDGSSPLKAARRAVSRSGDRWGAVYSPGEYAEFEQALDGTYTGVGIWARRSPDGTVRISGVKSGSPAAHAGLRTGDRLRRIDGRRVDRLPVTEVLARLRGDAGRTPPPGPGSAVTLDLGRGDRAWTATLKRARLSTDPVTVRRLGPGAGHALLIRVSSFTKGSGDRVREAVRAAPADSGVLLDLRGNSGGLVTEATRAASAFLDGGLVATYDVRGEQRSLHARRGGDTRRPVVTLVDGGTMSAAELLTGALQDRGRAVVVGSRTFGKGSVQMPSELPDGSVAELTVGHYRTPTGRNLDGHGITPDLEADEGTRARAEQVLTGLGTPS
ncbi:S41 family peptidase [Streptomyces sp. NPDC058045]|uniref:S41 family peptidase n=1 Tax=Streptomyces sp. NPDC058045 TaxID=3346311 RepID=UPI0036E3B0A3